MVAPQCRFKDGNRALEERLRFLVLSLREADVRLLVSDSSALFGNCGQPSTTATNCVR